MQKESTHRHTNTHVLCFSIQCHSVVYLHVHRIQWPRGTVCVNLLLTGLCKQNIESISFVHSYYRNPSTIICVHMVHHNWWFIFNFFPLLSKTMLHFFSPTDDGLQNGPGQHRNPQGKCKFSQIVSWFPAKDRWKDQQRSLCLLSHSVSLKVSLG